MKSIVHILFYDRMARKEGYVNLVRINGKWKVSTLPKEEKVLNKIK